MEAALRDTGVNDDEPKPLDPVALTLAVWLGLIVSVAGLVRLAADMPAPGLGVDAAMPLVLGFGV